MLERKDLRLKLDPDVHAALVALADVKRLELAEFAEQIVAADVRRRVHEATLIAQKTACLGFVGNRRESPGKSGKGGE
jgi:hypothetical protein